MTEPDRDQQPADHQAVDDAEDERVRVLLEQMTAMAAGDPGVNGYARRSWRSARRSPAGSPAATPGVESRSTTSSSRRCWGWSRRSTGSTRLVGDRFLAYAVPTMTGEVKRYFRDRTWRIRVPRELQERRVLLRAATRDFTSAHARSPTVPELAEAMDVTEEEVVEVIAASQAYQPMSLDTPIHDDENDSASMGDLIGDLDDGDLDLVVDKLALRPLLDRLPDRERGILLLRFYGNQTQAQIAEQTGISQMHISRLLRRSLDQLRTALLTDPEPPQV